MLCWYPLSPPQSQAPDYGEVLHHYCVCQKLISGVSIDLSLPCLWDKLFHWAWNLPLILNGQQDPRIFLCLSQCWDYRHGACILGLELSQILMLAQWAHYQPSCLPSFAASCFQMGLIPAETEAASNCPTVLLLSSTILLPVLLCRELASHNYWDTHLVRKSQGSKPKIVSVSTPFLFSIRKQLPLGFLFYLRKMDHVNN